MSHKVSGKPVSDRDICWILHDADDPVLTTKELAEHLPIGLRAAHKRLTKLTEEIGVVCSKKVGAKGRIWWLDDEVSENDLHMIDAAAAVDWEDEDEKLRDLVGPKRSTKKAYWQGRNTPQ